MAQRRVWRSPVVREARAAPELASFVVAAGPVLAMSPRGDGHTVLVLPGFGGGDLSTTPLRWLLDRLGYRSAGWASGPTAASGAA